MVCLLFRISASDIFAWTNPTQSEYYLFRFAANSFASLFYVNLAYLPIIPSTAKTREVKYRLIDQNFSWYFFFFSFSFFYSTLSVGASLFLAAYESVICTSKI